MRSTRFSRSVSLSNCLTIRWWTPSEAFAEQVKAAEDSGYITARAMEEVAEEVRETYPFHPSFKNLVALFKENEGFRQTRGLMQFTPGCCAVYGTVGPTTFLSSVPSTWI